MGMGRFAAAALLGLSLISGGVAAQTKPFKQARFPCGAGIAQYFSGEFQKAAFRLADVPAGHLNVQFIGHASFMVRSPGGVKVATDYNDFYRAGELPDMPP